jgi:hypothetical protein
MNRYSKTTYHTLNAWPSHCGSIIKHKASFSKKKNAVTS